MYGGHAAAYMKVRTIRAEYLYDHLLYSVGVIFYMFFRTLCFSEHYAYMIYIYIIFILLFSVGKPSDRIAFADHERAKALEVVHYIKEYKHKGNCEVATMTVC